MRAWDRLFRINPQVKLKKEIIVIPVDNTAVGNLGTNPVSKNVEIMGYANPIAIKNNIRDIDPKNSNGLFSLNNLIILHRILNPSLKVLNLL